jgi:hypothetical protein
LLFAFIYLFFALIHQSLKHPKCFYGELGNETLSVFASVLFWLVGWLVGWCWF